VFYTFKAKTVSYATQELRLHFHLIHLNKKCNKLADLLARADSLVAFHIYPMRTDMKVVCHWLQSVAVSELFANGLNDRELQKIKTYFI
jgi:hypothetical protein